MILEKDAVKLVRDTRREYQDVIIEIEYPVVFRMIVSMDRQKELKLLVVTHAPWQQKCSIPIP